MALHLVRLAAARGAQCGGGLEPLRLLGATLTEPGRSAASRVWSAQWQGARAVSTSPSAHIFGLRDSGPSGFEYFTPLATPPNIGIL